MNTDNTVFTAIEAAAEGQTIYSRKEKLGIFFFFNATTRSLKVFLDRKDPRSPKRFWMRCYVFFSYSRKKTLKLRIAYNSYFLNATES